MGFTKRKTDTEVIKKLTSPSEQEENYLNDQFDKSFYLPKTIDIADIDNSVFEMFDKGDFAIYVEDEELGTQKVPAFYLTNERWGDFSKTWVLSDQDKNIVPPFITITRLRNPKQGTYAGSKFNIPNRRTFTYVNVPTFENGRYGYDIYSVPQPVAIDLQYEINLYTRYTVDVNEFIKCFTKNFSSLQYYVTINGHYIRIIMEESFSDESTVDSIDGNRYYNPKQTITVKGYLLDEKDFKVIKSYNSIKTTNKIV